MAEMSERIYKLIEIVLNGKSFNDAAKELDYSSGVRARQTFFTWIRRLNPEVYDAGLSDEQMAKLKDHIEFKGDIGNYSWMSASPSITYLRQNKNFFTKVSSRKAIAKKTRDNENALNSGLESFSDKDRKAIKLVRMVLNNKSIKSAGEKLGYKNEIAARAAFYKALKEINPEKYDALLEDTKETSGNRNAAVPYLPMLRMEKNFFIGESLIKTTSDASAVSLASAKPIMQVEMKTIEVPITEAQLRDVRKVLDSANEIWRSSEDPDEKMFARVRVLECELALDVSPITIDEDNGVVAKSPDPSYPLYGSGDINKAILSYFGARPLTDNQCDEFRRLPFSFNDMVRAIYEAGRKAQIEEDIAFLEMEKSGWEKRVNDANNPKNDIFDNDFEGMTEDEIKDDINMSSIRVDQLEDSIFDIRDRFNLRKCFYRQYLSSENKANDEDDAGMGM